MSANDHFVIGIGNEFRCDDSAGLLVAKHLREANRPGVEVFLHHGEGTGLMALWQGRGIVVVIDAVSSGQPVGTLHLIDAIVDKIPPDMTPFSSHAFGLAEAVELSRDLGQLPEKLWIVGIEGINFSPGQGLSQGIDSTIAAAVQKVIELTQP